MARKKKADVSEIIQMFAKCTSNGFDRNLKDAHNPIYYTLSKRLKMKKSEVRKVILENQPSLTLRKVKKNENEQQKFKSNISNCSSGMDTISER